MRHRVKRKLLNRDSNNRKALLRGLVRSLVECGEITTTKAKAKFAQPVADKMIARAQQDTLAARRLLHRFFGVRDVVNTLVDQVAPAMKDRASGFTRIAVVGRRRGDNTELVKLSLVQMPETIGSLRAPVAPVEVKAAPDAAAAVTKKPAKPKAQVRK